MTKALLVVDVQFSMFFGSWPLPEAGGLLSRIANRVLWYRENNLPVVFIQNDGVQGDLDAPGMPYWELAIAPRQDELVVRKSTPNAFDSSTKLAQNLRSRGIEELELVGVQSELCLLATARGALAEGFDVLVSRSLHGTFNGDKPNHEISDDVQALLDSLIGKQLS